ncbi:hypothetical protein A1Q2_06518 [Trichosporon asahii var. asahii CBS 8904]|uniref:Zn(2)-C6 fungal-type domain-containing protein n=1 Tax=Trichosporon asahii var. asahii (strain CBS 8904) TaxID=1220162 RepID=K1V592_TRIAC|nr:hypothetical protein A1Q2_06518 [Trichosporon asahii var. asahii CBS 8904]
MDEAAQYTDILDDETLAPLKRNHACLQRKVKCDAVRPTCNPCLRSHAHAVRSAQRNKSKPPPLSCTYADDDEPEPLAAANGERKRVSSTTAGPKRAAIGGPDKLTRERERRAEEERDTLKARIVSNSRWGEPLSNFQIPAPQINGVPSDTLPFVSIEAGEAGQFQSFDFSNLLMMPMNWPKNLPSPAVLEHLIDIFFQCEPQISRILHRDTLMARVALPPAHPDFPFSGLLHAICAAAAPHTAVATSIPPQQLEGVRQRHIASGIDLENCEDFATAQTEAAERCIRHKTGACMLGSGPFIFDVTRANMILSLTYLNKGIALRSWIMSAAPVRLIHALEITNRNLRTGGKPPIMGAPATDREREERLATIWLTYMYDVGFAVNACWTPIFNIDTIYNALPTSATEFAKKQHLGASMAGNPQTAHEADVMVHHPVHDAFVLAVKASMLFGRVSKWLGTWKQRHVRAGDAQDALSAPSFVQLNAEIMAFQLSVPAAFKNIYKLVDSGDLTPFNADLLSLHIFPNTALLLLHEPLIDWKGPENSAMRQVQKSFEAIVGLLHLIPSQLDLSLVLTPLLIFCLFTTGRIITLFIGRAGKEEAYAHSMRWKTDLGVIQAVMERYGTKHSIGVLLGEFLKVHMQLGGEPEHMDDMCARRMRDVCATSSVGELNSGSGYGAVDGPGNPETGGTGYESQSQSQSAGSGPSTTSIPGLSPPTKGNSGTSASVGQTPESVDAVDFETQARTYFPPSNDNSGTMSIDEATNGGFMNLNGGFSFTPGSHASSGSTPNGANAFGGAFGTLGGSGSGQGIDPALLDILDPTGSIQAHLSQGHKGETSAEAYVRTLLDGNGGGDVVNLLGSTGL